MRILITNNTLRERAGTELYVRDIAVQLVKAGHTPVCFSLVHGAVAEELAQRGIQVVRSLGAELGPFDVIHGHHHVETSLAALAYPRVPVISFCHGPRPWQESPAFLPSVVAHVAVDDACKQRLINAGVPAGEIIRILNFVDTEVFLPRGPLPSQPRRALVFSNSASESSHLPIVREACERHGISLDVAGFTSGNVTDHPEELLPQYDLVFAKARAAMEAMAVGCAVIQCDYYAAGHLVTPRNFDALRQLNFGFLSLDKELLAHHLAREIGHYNPTDSAAVSARIRAEASLAGAMPQLLALYERVAATPVPEWDPWSATGFSFLEDIILGAKESKSLATKLSQSALPSVVPKRNLEDLVMRAKAKLGEALSLPTESPKSTQKSGLFRRFFGQS